MDKYVEVYDKINPNEYIFDHFANGYPGEIVELFWKGKTNVLKPLMSSCQVRIYENDGDIFYYWNDFKDIEIAHPDFIKWCDETKRIRNNVKTQARKNKKTEQSKKEHELSQKLTDRIVELENCILILESRQPLNDKESMNQYDSSSIKKLDEKMDIVINSIQNMEIKS